MLTASVTNNMTLVTTSQTADATVSNGRVLIEFDNTAAPTLNTDLTVEVTCDGGTHWTTVTTSLDSTAASFADTGLATGTDFTYQVEALNAGGASAPTDPADALTEHGASTNFTAMPISAANPIQGSN